MMKKFKFCPSCKEEITKTRNFYRCNTCGFVLYRHSYPTASAFPVKDGKVLLAIRAEEPRKGMVDTLGGFCNYGEHPEKALQREVKEESNLNIKILARLGVYVDDYKFNGDTLKTLNFNYVIEFKKGKMKIQDDVAAVKWFPIDKIPFDKLAFDSHKKAFKDLIKWYKNPNENH